MACPIAFEQHGVRRVGVSFVDLSQWSSGCADLVRRGGHRDASTGLYWSTTYHLGIDLSIVSRYWRGDSAATVVCSRV